MCCGVFVFRNSIKKMKGLFFLKLNMFIFDARIKLSSILLNGFTIF